MKFPTLICAVVLTGTVSASMATKAHQFEDGFVERTVAVVVRDQTAHVEYSIGLNESTVQGLLADWERSASQNTAQSDSSSQEDQPNLEPEKSGGQRPATSTGSTVTSSSTSLPPANKTDVRNEVKKSVGTNTGQIKKTDRPEQSELANSDAEHFIAPELFARFQELAPIAIANGLKINCNGKPVTIEYVSAGPPPRHPFTITIRFTFSVPDSKTCDLKISDDNFTDHIGAVRYALKAAGRAMLMQSDAAPVLVRAERSELAELSKKERMGRTSIKARLGFAPVRKD